MTFARTKIQPPRPRAGFVERGSLHARLAEALQGCRVVLVCAPAGYGKTMLLAQEVARLPAGTAVAWISVDAGDDLQRLVECMLAALEPFDPPWRTAPESLLARVGRSDDERRAVAAEVLNALDASEVRHGVIVFDDLHRVGDPELFRFLDLLVERLSPRWTLALSSRTDPPLALARLRGSDELAEFRQLELQFARDDARRMVSASGIDPALADRLFDRTQGWPAGLRIAIGAARADRVGASGAVERALRAGNRPLFDFLLTEVLGDLKPELAEFLLRVSVLSELEAKRCVEVSGNANAAALLDAIERLALFVEVLDAPVRTLRLHDLLRDALQQRLALERPELLRELRGRAADSEPDPARRVALRLDAEDYVQAARDVYDHVPPIIATSGTSSAMRVIERFPAAFRDRSPELAFVRGLVEWIHWDFPAMLAALGEAERGFAARGDQARALHARAVRVHGLIGEGMIDQAIVALDSLAQAALPRETRIMMLNAQSWLDIDLGRLRAVAPIVDEKVALLEKVDRLDLWYHTTPSNRMPWLPGVAKPLRRHADALLRAAGDTAMPLRAIAYLVQAWGAAAEGRFEQAHERCERAREEAVWTGGTAAILGHMYLLKAVLHVVEGDAAAAVESAQARVRALQGGYGVSGQFILTLLAVRIAAAGEDVVALRGLVDTIAMQMAQFDPEGKTPRTLPRLPMIAQLAWLEGRVDDAIAGWRDALRFEEAIDLFGHASETRMRLARALVRQGDVAGAAKVLAPVFARAEADGAPGGVWLAANALGELAGAGWGGSLPTAQRATLRAWAQTVAAARAARASVTSPAPAAGVAPGEAAAPGESLSPRELDVLRRIASGDSNKVIARALDLSPHTVKRHVANILGKLGVETRGQAAARYRALPK